MISLETLSQDFSRPVRNQGEEYFRQGRVSLVRATDHSAYARVRGTQTYVSEITWDEDGILDATCTCPYFDQYDALCKHLYATILEAQSTGHLSSGAHSRSNKNTPPLWKQQIELVRKQMEEHQRYSDFEKPSPTWPADQRINYLFDLPTTLSQHDGSIVIELATQRLKSGVWDRPKKAKLTQAEWMAVPDPANQHALQMLMGTKKIWDYSSYNTDRQFVLPTGRAAELILQTLCQTGQCKFRQQPNDSNPPTLAWDDGPPWEFRVRINPGEKNVMNVTGRLTRGSEEMLLHEPALILRTGLLVARGHISRLNHAGAFDLLALLRDTPDLTVPRKEAGTLVEELYRLPRPPAMDLPDDLSIVESSPTLLPILKVKAAAEVFGITDRLRADLTYEYDGHPVIPGQKGAVIFDTPNRRILRRNPAAESAAMQRIIAAGFKYEWHPSVQHQILMIASPKFAKAVQGLVADGWRIEADGKLWRSPTGTPTINVTSGIDWFELDAKINFDNTTAPLPRLLQALQRGQNTVLLDDGSMGVLPEEWLKKYAPLASLGEEKDGKLRFSSSQVGFLDALLASSPDAKWDAAYETARKRLREFEGIHPADPPKSFVGNLRPYQNEGLGWLHFLREFGFGGCLADDMGLGKTIQVLALLAGRKQSKPSLVVAPRSLIFNWMAEAKRFAPKLRVLDHSPAGRTRATEAVHGHDLILTTYGTLRRDAGYLKDVHFDYVILDESQAIKNATTASAKAARLLKADHRLALSGTPIENHLGELWSLLEFLNPGMLGTAGAFRQWSGGQVAPDPAARETLARAIRPFILRRTKKQVAKDLPERTEQTIWCELDPPQRKLYDELRDHYRASLLDRIKKEGMNKAKIQILEALLRLRQAACHPGLIDPKLADAPSAKFESLFADLEEVMKEGHKVLVFSQFTSLLALAKRHLDKQKIAYEYLDGKTKDRQARVERFQNDPDLKLFLISLKAGGVGLNLTAADYVFLLDPWWNPAAEAQAIDRAHRIGQSRNVFAYRLIAKNTVEEKVLELQQTKRDLADAIITADNALLSKLGREDLERLLS
ncbi:MAG TPA: DEAD/DEAH box helicase [Tepidisphaeraceae bacterium]|jgi:superfamily II DNA or RNA helicase|nr:DEAD/DEAH box helicase [Tepidisphaeraceae bacterium]